MEKDEAQGKLPNLEDDEDLDTETKPNDSETTTKTEDDSTSEKSSEKDGESPEPSAEEQSAADEADKEKSKSKADDDLASSLEIENESNSVGGDSANEETERPAKVKTAEAVLGADNLIEIEDPDDYLLYLETILLKIHSSFYEFYDENKQVRLFVY